MFKIVKVKGDVLKPDQWLNEEHTNGVVHVIHGCNNCGVMGSGVASQVKKLSKQAFGIYKNQVEFEGEKSLGLWSMTSDFKPENYKARLRIINAITQNSYGNDKSIRYTSYDAVADIFKSLAKYFRGTYLGSHKIVAIPKLFASDRGNGDWSVVKKIIQSEFKDIDLTLYIVEYDRG